MALVSTAPLLSDSVDILSTSGYFYISAEANPDLKTLVAASKTAGEIPTSGLMKIGKFVSGTFSFDGEAATITPLTYEDGTSYYTTSTVGTESVAGEMPDLSPLVLKLFLGGNDVDTSAFTGMLADYNVFATGRSLPNLDNRLVVFEFTQGGAYDWMAYPNAKISTSKAGSGSADGTVTLLFNISASAAEGSNVPADISGHNILWGKKK